MKKILLIAAMTIFSAVSHAQEYNLKVTGADVQLLAEGLGAMPYGKIAPLMQKLQTQIIEQQKPPVTPDAPKPQNQDKN